MPAFIQWLNNKARLGTPDEIVLAIVPSLLTSFGFTAVLNKY